MLGYDKVFLEHRTGEHPECPERLGAIMAKLERKGLLDELVEVERRVEPDKWIETIHTQTYIDRLKRACQDHEPYIDSADSAICPDSYRVAREAVGVALGACEMIMMGQASNGFCALRPPGHHAEHDKSMGFCLFNNIAIASKYLQQQHGLKRILILDWDVHHGNGSQHSFEADDTVFYCSLHQDPATLYPGTGRPDEVGVGKGRGYTLNLALEPGTGDEAYMEMFRSCFLTAARDFRPNFVLVSAGYDGHRNDPLAQLNLTEKAYGQMTREVKGLAREFCDGRLLSLLEGGYDLETLGDCVLGHVKELMN